jgi:hypothetical protein
MTICGISFQPTSPTPRTMHAGPLGNPVARADPPIQVAIDDCAPAKRAQLHGKLWIGRDELDLHVSPVLRNHRHASDGVLDLHRSGIGGARALSAVAAARSIREKRISDSLS